MGLSSQYGFARHAVNSRIESGGLCQNRERVKEVLDDGV